MATVEAPFIRFHKKVCKSNRGCWVWKGSTGTSGYGQFKAFGRMVSAHRFAFELYHGPIPQGLEILHSCDRKDCVNPHHLRASTHSENMREASERGLMPSGPQHHLFGKTNARPKQANVVAVLGRRFSSQKEAERHFGLGSGTVRYWLKNKPEKAQILSRGSLTNA